MASNPPVFNNGDLVRIEGRLTDLAGDLTDPDGVAFYVEPPVGETVEYVYGVDAAVVRVDEGIYYLDVSAIGTGLWHWRLASTGNGQAADEGSFKIKTSNFV